MRALGLQHQRRYRRAHSRHADAVTASLVDSYTVAESLADVARTLRTFMKRNAIFALVCLLTASACGQQSPACAPIAMLPIPAVQLLYPVPNASGVSTNPGVLIYASSQTIPVTLRGGGLNVGTSATSVPHPLPQPIAPLLPGQRRFAVAHSVLATQTTYAVVVTLPEVESCGNGGTTRMVETTIAQFKTH